VFTDELLVEKVEYFQILLIIIQGSVTSTWTSDIHFIKHILPISES